MSKEKQTQKVFRSPIKFPIINEELTESKRAQLKSLKQNILTEHFSFSPEVFAKQATDLANVSMYRATGSVMTMLQSTSDQAETPFLDEEEITKGIYRMETLLESSIDTHFDMFELYVLRNTFALRDELIPFIQLSHQKEFNINSRGMDEIALNEYREELKLYEEELVKQRELACAAEYINKKLESVQKRAQEYGYMRGAEPISSTTQMLVSQLPYLEECLTTLLATSTQTKSKPDSSIVAGPWGTTRASYVNWAATNKVDALPSGSSARETTSSTEDLLHSQRTGDAEAAINLIAALSAN